MGLNQPAVRCVLKEEESDKEERKERKKGKFRDEKLRNSLESRKIFNKIQIF